MINVEEKLAETIKMIKKPLSEWNEDDCVSVISTISSAGSSSFDKARKKVIEYFEKYYVGSGENTIEILNSITYRDISMESIINKYYYFSLSHLKSAIDKTINYLCEKTGATEDAYLMYKVVIYLFWYGFTIKEATEIRIDEVSDNGRFIKFKGGNYEFPSGVASDVYRLASLEGYYVARQKELPYYVTMVKSPYLFRTSREEKISDRTLSDRLIKLNKRDIERLTKQKFLREKIIESRRFINAYFYELQTGIPVYNMAGSQFSLPDDLFCERMLFGTETGKVTPITLRNAVSRYHGYKNILNKRFEIGKKSAEYRDFLVRQFAIEEKVMAHTKELLENVTNE